MATLHTYKTQRLREHTPHTGLTLVLLLSHMRGADWKSLKNALWALDSSCTLSTPSKRTDEGTFTQGTTRLLGCSSLHHLPHILSLLQHHPMVLLIGGWQGTTASDHNGLRNQASMVKCAPMDIYDVEHLARLHTTQVYGSLVHSLQGATSLCQTMTHPQSLLMTLSSKQ